MIIWKISVSPPHHQSEAIEMLLFTFINGVFEINVVNVGLAVAAIGCIVTAIYLIAAVMLAFFVGMVNS